MNTPNDSRHILLSLLGFVFVGVAILYSAQLALAQPSSPGQTIPVATALVYLPSVYDIEPTATPTPTPTSTPQPTATPEPTPTDIPLPTCPTTSNRQYTLIPVLPPPADHPDELHGDLNLALRAYVTVSAAPTIVDISGPADSDAPFFPAIFGDARTPAFTSTHRVYDWNWACGPHGCRGDNLTAREVTLLGMGAAQGEAIAFPSRNAEIYVGGFRVLVLYASEERITLGYTRDDSVAPGYAVHLEGVCVDPNLLALYRQANQAGRGNLPALRNGEVVGTVKVNEVLAAIRDRGDFMDPRARKDWWRGR